MKGFKVLFLAIVVIISSAYFTPCPAAVQKGTILQTGTIKGRIVDAGTLSPLAGASIILLNTKLGASADLNGEFEINTVPAGSYSVMFRYIGYKTYTMTDVIVKVNRTTNLDVTLELSVVESGEIVVSGGYFKNIESQPLSSINFSQEEIRRAPGSAGDISRIIMGLPSLAKVNDQSNSLIVRGGSPIENAFMLDNIEIPNINHFPVQGSSGGPIGLLNVDFIKDVNFITGGFQAGYGNRLSSIMEISMREGNRTRTDGQVDLNFTGFGLQAEGPWFNKKGSWLFSIRRSYFDLLAKMVNIGTSSPPSYGDIQGKFTYDINESNKLSLLIVGSDDHNKPDIQSAEENDMIYYGPQDIYENTAGVNWLSLRGNSGYSNTSISYSASSFKEDYYETNSGIHLIKNRSGEGQLSLRNSNHFRLSNNTSVEFGLDFKQLFSHFDNNYSEYTTSTGEVQRAFEFSKKFKALKSGAYAVLTLSPVERLSAVLGLRGDYFSYNKRFHISPRLTLTGRLSSLTTVTASAGLYYQNLPVILLAQNSIGKDLKDPSAVHYILGISHLLTENTRASLEVYRKDYSYFPLDPSQSPLFMIDELFYRYGFFFNHPALIDNGKARSEGIEFTLQKKLADKLYGLISATYFRSVYMSSDGLWRNRSFDNRFIFSIEGGYKPGNKWEFSLRWIYAGGTPYTPLNLEESQRLKREVLDEGRINQERYPAYHSLNIRCDRRFNFSSTNLIVYFSIWNAYNRKNVAGYFWDGKENRQGTIYQWNLLPVIGMEFEF